jgi:hypothetical protein
MRAERALDDVEIDSGAFACGGGFDERAESADDASLAADDFADVFFVDFQLVDRGVAILDLVDFDRGGLIDERAGDVFDEPFQIGLELFELLFVLYLLFVLSIGDWLGWLFGHGLTQVPLSRALT